MRHLACGRELLGGALQLECLLRDLVPSFLRLFFCLHRFGIRRLCPRSLRRVEQRETDRNADRGIVRLKLPVELVVVVEFGEASVLSGEVKGRKKLVWPGETR